MCIICVDFQKQLITAAEARRNADESVTDLKHLFELMLMLEKDKMEKLKTKGRLPTRTPKK